MMRNFEREQERMAERLLIEKAYEVARKEIERDAINPEDFRSLYGDQIVDADIAYVSRMEEIFARDASESSQEAHKVGTVFEAIFHEQAELSDWLGPDAMTIKTSRFDDIKNGIDSIVETRHDDRTASYLGVAIDVTSGTDLDKKMRRIKDEIEKGELGQVKYFNSEHTPVRGEFRGIPRVVVGVSGKAVQELAELWLNKDKKALGAHSIQFQILEEMKIQFAAFRAFALKKKREKIARLYGQAYKDVSAVLDAKRKAGLNDSGDRDEVFSSIESWMRNFEA